MRKTTKRVVRRALTPTLISTVTDTTPEANYRAAVLAFRQGWADTAHWNTLNTIRDMLIVGAKHKNDESALTVTYMAGIALTSIKDRYQEKGRMGATGEELKTLDLLVDTSMDFWKRQPGTLYIAADQAVDQVRELRRKEAA